MRERRMAAMPFDPSLSLQINKEHQQEHRVVIEEIEGLIKVYRDGHVERPQIVPSVSCAVASNQCATSMDVILDNCANVWARFYLPKSHYGKLPLLVYFHGGGFCVGSASWSCYHEFLAKLAAKSNCVIMSVNYRLAPENPLPAAHDDGFKALFWTKQQSHHATANEWFTSKWDLHSIFLGGDSAGANIAYNIAIQLGTPGGAFESSALLPLGFKGCILIQPFFGGESRTYSEKYMVQPPSSVLTMAASDAYWRLSLPRGANRDHPWCNPLAKGAPKLEEIRLVPTLVCVAEMDILKDRNLELCAALVRAGKKVEHVMVKGVGHGFQILNKSQISLTRTDELMGRIKAFIGR